ncbi:MAG TPA: type II secretion system F family protein [Caulobacteraceae bacterium]
MILPLDIIIEAITFGIVVAGSLALLRGIEAIIDVRRRLGQDPATATRAGPASVFRGDTVRNPILLWVQSSTSLNDSKDRQKLRRELSQAGFDHPAAPVWYVIARFALAIGLPFLFLLSQKFAAKPMGGFGLIVVALILCGLGLIAPHMFVSNRGSARREQIEHEFPDALDLMVVCVEAGLGLEAAFIRVGQETLESHPRIAEEFNRVSDELRAGRGRADALRSLADRTDVDPIKSFVALLIQTDALGTSIGQTLRSYAVEMREHRFLKAEEKAMRIPVLMTVPLVACILPVIITALLLPPILDVMRTLIPALAGHH